MRELSLFGGIARRGNIDSMFEEINFACHVFGEFEVFILGGQCGEIGGGGFDDLIGLRGNQLGIVSDECLLDPLCAARSDPDIEEFRFGRFDKFAGGVGCDRLRS